MIDGPVWLIGCGNMGGAMLRGWLSSGLSPEQVVVIDPAKPDLPNGVVVHANLHQQAIPPKLMVLAIKPQMLGQIAPQLSQFVKPDTVLLSILAGVEIATIDRFLPGSGGIARVMPNTPAAIGKGISAAFIPAGSNISKDMIGSLLSPLGDVEWFEDEADFHGVTALSGSGPAFVFRFIAALAEAGEAQGLDADKALRLAIATVEGAAALAKIADEDPEELARRVTSPNGTTAAGLAVLDAEARLPELLNATLAAAADRSKALAQEAAL